MKNACVSPQAFFVCLLPATAVYRIYLGCKHTPNSPIKQETARGGFCRFGAIFVVWRRMRFTANARSPIRGEKTAFDSRMVSYAKRGK